MEITGDAQHDRYERVYHGGTFNANPYCAATGNAALNIVATGEMQANADRMAERLRVGLRVPWENFHQQLFGHPGYRLWKRFPERRTRVFWVQY